MFIFWTPETNEKLLIELLRVCDIKLTAVNYADIAAAMGPDVTPRAVSQHICRMRAKVKGSPSGTASAPNTPTSKAKTTTRKPKAAAASTPSTKKNGNGKRGLKSTTPINVSTFGGVFGEDGDDDEELDTKRVKRELSNDFYGVLSSLEAERGLGWDGVDEEV
ncbi:hypothetical protein K432DRAFT_380208 [Lepidopterella palustris CBS 459.81]|uniref:Myb-like domain-containing protein n=1 Tax=Lepidopterella palustris CBS 459.81 TaxID=1314670 RepID=A0A8E2EEV7_9PEZI|nr:hypothetical protein K432DRAFT_380208 [Lepidopterella palustris CBS 459.81]